MRVERLLSDAHSSRAHDAPKHKMLVPEQRFLSVVAAPALDLLSHLILNSGDLFRELLSLLLGLSTKLLGLVDDGVGALLGLLGGLAELAFDSGNTVLCLELESLLAATHAVTVSAILLRFGKVHAVAQRGTSIRTTSAERSGNPG